LISVGHDASDADEQAALVAGEILEEPRTCWCGDTVSSA
jgi:hypothetical protein